MTGLTEKQMDDFIREYDYIHSIQRSRRVGVITFSSPTRQRKTMNELTKEQIKEMEAAWKEYYGPVRADDLELIDTPIMFKAGYTAAVNRECVWTADETDLLTSCDWRSQYYYTFCPNCGGKVVEGE